MLSGQAFKRGEESGSQQNSKMDEFTNSAVWGYPCLSRCLEPGVWKPAEGEKLHAEQEFDNLIDKFAVKVTKNSETVGHLPHKYSRISCYFLARGGKIPVEVTGRR